MTVAVETPWSSSTGDGSTTSFLLGFTYSDVGEVEVEVLVDGAATVMDYTIIGQSLVFDTAPPVGATVNRRRVTVVDQAQSFPADGRFPSIGFEDQLDRHTRAIQERIADAARTLRIPDLQGMDPLPGAADRAGKYLAFEVGTGIPVAVDGSTSATTNAAFVDSDDGSSGSLWSSVQGFINYLKANDGAGIVGLSQSATYAAGTVGAKLREFVSVKDFGAVGNGVADDTAAIQAALNAASCVFFPAGVYKITNVLSQGFSGQRVIGAGYYGYGSSSGSSSATIKQSNGAKGIFKTTANAFSLSDLQLDYSVTPTAGNAIDIGHSGSQLHRIWCGTCWNGIYYHDNTGHQFSSVNFLNVRGSFGLNVTNTNDIEGVNSIFQSVDQVGASDGMLSLSGYVQAVKLTNVSFLNGSLSMACHPTGSTIATSLAFCKFTSCFFDGSANGASVDGAHYFGFTDCWFSNRPGAGITIGATLTTYGTTIIGGQAVSCGAHGVVIGANAKHTTINGLKPINNSQSAGAGVAHGISVTAGATDFTITNCQATNTPLLTATQGYGILINTGASDYYIVSNNKLNGNATGGLADGGTGTHKTITGNL